MSDMRVNESERRPFMSELEIIIDENQVVLVQGRVAGFPNERSRASAVR